jgi:glycerol-3-phosphate cytidylyltransferase-like family protein
VDSAGEAVKKTKVFDLFRSGHAKMLEEAK